MFFYLVRTHIKFGIKIFEIEKLMIFDLLTSPQGHQFDHRIKIKFWSYARECEFGILKKKKHKKTRKIFRLCFWLKWGVPEGEKTIPLWRVLQGITVCLVSTILGTVWWPGRFQTVSRGQVLVFFYRHSTRMYLMEEKQVHRSLRASRDGHSSSSSISPTLLVFRHLLKVQRAAVLWNFSIWLNWSFE